MEKQKQIEEMAIDLRKVSEKVQDRCDEIDCRECGLDPFGKIECKYLARAKMLLEKGYRKQVQGEWIEDTYFDTLECSVCGAIAPVDCEKEKFYKSNYCPNCGAKMKGN